MIAKSILLWGLILSLLASSIIVATLFFRPRLLLQRYPKDVQQMVPGKTDREKRETRWVGILFILILFMIPLVSTISLKTELDDFGFPEAFGHAFGILTVFNLVDLLIIDWLLFVRIRPRFLVIPGSEGAKGYEHFSFHVRGFATGTVLALIASALIAVVASVL